MKINDLGKLDRVDEGPISWAKEKATQPSGVMGNTMNYLARKGLSSNAFGMRAQQSYERSAAMKAHKQDFMSAFQDAWEQAKNAGMVSLKPAPATAKQGQPTQPGQPGGTQAGAQAGAQQGQSVGAQATTAAQPTSTPTTPTTPTAPTTTSQQNQANLKARLKTGQGMGKKTGTGYAQSRVGVPVQRLSGADASGAPKFRTVREDIFANYSYFDNLLESMVTEQAGVSPKTWINNYITNQTQNSGIDINKFKGTLTQLAKDFEASVYGSGGKFPTDIADKIYSFYVAAASSSPKLDKYGSSLAVGGKSGGGGGKSGGSQASSGSAPQLTQQQKQANQNQLLGKLPGTIKSVISASTPPNILQAMHTLGAMLMNEPNGQQIFVKNFRNSPFTDDVNQVVQQMSAQQPQQGQNPTT